MFTMYVQLQGPRPGMEITAGVHEFAAGRFLAPSDWRRSLGGGTAYAFMRRNIPTNTNAIIRVHDNNYAYVSHVEWWTHRDGGRLETIEAPIVRTCSRCARSYYATLDNFYARGHGLSSWCKDCTRAYARSRREIAVHGRRFGVEIEFTCMDENGYPMDDGYIAECLQEAGINCAADGYTHEVLDCWKIVSDSSVESGWELVSPPLRWADRHEIQTACDVLRDLGAETDYQCGLHVHHEVADLTVSNFKKLYSSWNEWQGHSDSLVSPSRREGNWSGHASNSELDQMEGMSTLADLSEDYYERYRALNVTCYPSYGTVEVRLHQGTLSANKIISWVAYGQAIIKAATSQGEILSDCHTHEFLDALPFTDDAHRESLKVTHTRMNDRTTAPVRAARERMATQESEPYSSICTCPECRREREQMGDLFQPTYLTYDNGE